MPDGRYRRHRLQEDDEHQSAAGTASDSGQTPCPRGAATGGTGGVRRWQQESSAHSSGHDDRGAPGNEPLVGGVGMARAKINIEADRLLNLALARRLEIIGKAAGRVSAALEALERILSAKHEG